MCLSTERDDRATRHTRIMISMLGALLAAPLAAQGPVGTCAGLPDKLAACEAYECGFTHPFTGTEETRTVAPEDDGMCLYRESMPNGGQMTCRYDETGRNDMADFYRASFDAFSSGGEPPDNSILETAMADGTCAVSGYDN